jgi:hypothetical protein
MTLPDDPCRMTLPGATHAAIVVSWPTGERGRRTIRLAGATR